MKKPIILILTASLLLFIALPSINAGPPPSQLRVNDSLEEDPWDELLGPANSADSKTGIESPIVTSKIDQDAYNNNESFSIELIKVTIIKIYLETTNILIIR